MKRNFKLAVLLLAVLAMAVCFAVCVNADEAATASTVTASGTTSNLTWTLTDDGTLTIGGQGAMDDYYMGEDEYWHSPQPWNEYLTVIKKVIIQTGVTTIGDYAFLGCTSLTGVTIPDSVMSIGHCAFRYCESLTSITISERVTSIGDMAFYYCEALDTVYHTGSPSSWNRISIGEKNEYLTNAELVFICADGTPHDFITHEGKAPTCTESGWAEYVICSKCEYSTYEEIHVGHNYVDGVCENCGMRDPDYIYIESYIESGVTGNLNWVITTDYILVISGQGAMPNYGHSSQPWKKYLSTIEKVVIKNGVTSIGDFAFSSCTSLTSVTIPDSVTSINYNAFYACTSLTSIIIPDSVTSIGVAAFEGCISLTSVAIPDSVMSIGAAAFYCCESLTSVTLSKNITSIEECAFWDCTSLKNVTLPKNITNIGQYAFSRCASLVSVTIPDSVTSIGVAAFKGCISLTSVAIPDSVMSMGADAFYGCKSLTSVTLPKNITSIEECAFRDCTSLTSVTIPDGVTSIGKSAFYWCTSLTSVTIPDGVTSIGESAFYYCKSLTSVTIPDGVTSIGESAFYWCTSLTSVTIGNGVTSIGYMAFHICDALKTVYYTGSPLGWNQISIESGNIYLTNAELVFINEDDTDCESGFIQNEYGIRYYYDDGSYATGFTEIDGKTYYFNSNGYLFEGESMELWSMTYYFNADHSAKEGLILDEDGYRYYVKGVRNYGWVDTDGDGVRDSYFYVSNQLRCEEDRVLFDGVDARRFFKYNKETGHMELVNGFYTNEKGTQYFVDGLGAYGWITADGVSITDKPGITLSDVHYFAYGDGINFYMVEDSTKTIGGVVREFDENHLVKSYTGWATNKKTGNANYYINGEMQQGWCETPDGWVYLSRSENLANNITYGDVFYGWRKIGGKVYYFRASTSNPAYVIISDPERQLTYNGVRSTYYINQPKNLTMAIGADYYIINPPAGF